MTALRKAPQRAQRVRGVPGVGLRTPDGREWLRWGEGHRWDPETVTGPSGRGWVVARCDHDGGGVVLADDDVCREMGFRWSVCDGCANMGMATFAVKSCTRPGKYGNPYTPSKAGDVWWVKCNGVPCNVTPGTEDFAVNLAVSLFGLVVNRWPASRFTELAKFRYLSCFCSLDAPCHVDAIIAEGARRGIWGGG